jgi:hypothetical protein
MIVNIRLKIRESNFDTRQEQKFFSSLRVQIIPKFYPVGTEAPFALELKRPGGEADHSPPSNVEIEKSSCRRNEMRLQVQLYLYQITKSLLFITSYNPLGLLTGYPKSWSQSYAHWESAKVMSCSTEGNSVVCVSRAIRYVCSPDLKTLCPASHK